MSICLITSNVNLDHLIKVVSATMFFLKQSFIYSIIKRKVHFENIWMSNTLNSEVLTSVPFPLVP